MINQFDHKKLLLPLLAAGLLLPVAVTVAVGLAGLLGALGDAAGATVLRYVAVALGAAWTLVLVSLVLLQAFVTLSSGDDAEK